MRTAKILPLGLLLSQLAPPGAHAESVFSTIYNFTNGFPVGFFAHGGVLYGGFQGIKPEGVGCGDVFELQPPAAYEIGSGNVFADLGLGDADDLLTRARLGHTVRLILKARKLKQREIAGLLGIDQAEVSKLINGQYHLFAEGRLFAFLKALEQKVTIHVRRRHKGEPYQEVTLAT
jgi:predicted XRE-type DNA-binding protein